MGTRKAFTLAEVLVTLGIIGVVSAMTIPSLTQNWQKKSYVTQLHKAYNEIQQALIEEMNDKNALNLIEAGFIPGTGKEKEFLNNHFKIVQDCSTLDSGIPCFANMYRSQDGRNSQSASMSGYKVATASGYAISMNIIGAGNADPNTIWQLGAFIVDINGSKGPNIGGRDFFVMYFFPDGSLDELYVSINCRKNGTNCGSGNSATAKRESTYSSSCKNSVYGHGCFGKLLNDNWEMNY